MSSDVELDPGGGGAPTVRLATVSALELRLRLAAGQQELVQAQHRLIEHYTRLEQREQQTASPAEERDTVRDWAEFVRLADRLTVENDDCRSLRGVPPPAGGGALWGYPESARRHPTIVDHRVLDTPNHLRGVDTTQVRMAASVPTSMVIGGRTALIAPDGAGRWSGLLLRTAALVEIMTHHFDCLWSRSVPLAERQTGESDGPTAVQSQILRLAASGAKDEAIARSLGRSPRWVRRHFELLSERLGASNRLTLGVAAAQRGWI
ncbi:hypothetical protein ABZ749_03435 [Micromonospora sp. NPDC047753]|uniref:helix-turn-helix transcriptional regulator n=1 Tax=Micromonospora sp. NPDC047753 TaxID=3154817 RepID=UPI0033D6E19C